MKQKIQKYKSIDLFAGIGGIRLGFDQAFGDKIETVFVSEWDEFAQKTYKANFHDDLEIAGDITKIDEKNIPDFDMACIDFQYPADTFQESTFPRAVLSDDRQHITCSCLEGDIL